MRTWRDSRDGTNKPPTINLSQAIAESGIVALPPASAVRTIRAKMISASVGTKLSKLGIYLSENATTWRGPDEDATLARVITTTQLEYQSEYKIDPKWNFIKFVQSNQIGTFSLELEVA